METERFMTGLIGRNIARSRSPAMHEAEADSQGLRLIYSLFDFAALDYSEHDLPRLLSALQLAGFSGVNVTHPYKQTIIESLDALSDEAASIGAVNTVAFTDGRRIGHNTDVTGFAAAFRESLDGVGLSDVVQIGAGGAGSATAFALLSLGAARLTVFDSDFAKATALCRKLSARYDTAAVSAGSDIEGAVRNAEGIVNATPMGMAEHPGMPLPEALLRREHWVAEIVYFPLETALLAAAKRTGCRIMDGAGMAVWQAARAFEIFTGRPAQAVHMRAAFEAQTN
jgi:shikimate dehydrogenase